MDGLPLPSQAVDTLSGTLIGAAFLVCMGVIAWLIIRADRRTGEREKALTAQANKYEAIIAKKDEQLAELYETGKNDALLFATKAESISDQLAQEGATNRAFYQSIIDALAPRRRAP